MHTGPDPEIIRRKLSVVRTISARYDMSMPLVTKLVRDVFEQDKLKESGVVDKLAPVTSAATETKVCAAG